MRSGRRAWVLVLLLGVSGAASAQLGLPRVAGVLGRVDGALDTLARAPGDIVRDATALASARIDRLDAFLQANRALVERDDDGQPARAREVLMLDPDDAALAHAQAAGFRLIEMGDIGGLGIAYARLTTPPHMHLAAAIRALRRIVPGKQVTADQIHFASGAASSPAPTGVATEPPAPHGGTVGIIDGGVAGAIRIAAQAGFAEGAPRPDPHAQAIASLLAGAGTVRIDVADVYGSDPAGGGALAIARALGWMAARDVPVVSISLVGPANPLLARAIAAVQTKGMIVTAAVGNDGPAAPPAYPASYPGVVAVTGVDRHGRVLIEAGRASHLDYAAPGADLTVPDRGGRRQLRGTSYAAPLVAARLAALGGAAATPATRLSRADAEAVGRSPRTGRGVLCDACRSGI